MKVAALALFALCAPQEVPSLSVEGVRDVTDEGRVWLEIEPARHGVFVHEALPVTLRVGFELEFLQEEMIQLFRRELDVPAQLQTEDIEAYVEAGEALGDVSLSWNAAVVRGQRVADRNRGGHTYRVLELEGRMTFDVAGERTIDGGRLRFAYASAFREDLIQGWVPVDRLDAFVRAPSVSLEVMAPPEAERPPSWIDAVGRFRLTAAVSATEIGPQDSLKLTLELRGAGNLDGLTLPALGNLEGFRSLGQLEVPLPEGRAVTYDLAPERTGSLRIPPIRFSFFDPGPPAAYRSIESAPLSVRVLAPATARPEADPAPQPGRSGLLFGGAALLVTAGLLALLLLRRRKRVPLQPGVHTALAIFDDEAHLEDPMTTLTVFLARVLHVPLSRIQASDLAARLERSGVSPELAGRAQTRLAQLEAARYGRRESQVGTSDLRGLAEQITAAIERGAAQ